MILLKLLCLYIVNQPDATVALGQHSRLHGYPTHINIHANSLYSFNSATLVLDMAYCLVHVVG